MCLDYDEIKAYLHYYAGRFQSRYFEHDELVNEAWVIVHKLEHIEFASQGIRWAMMTYMNKQKCLNHKRNKTAIISSIDNENINGSIIRDIIECPKVYNQTLEDSEFIEGILDKAHLSMYDRILIDQIYFRGWALSKIAKLRGCTYEAVRQKLNKTLEKITKVAMREVA